MLLIVQNRYFCSMTIQVKNLDELKNAATTVLKEFPLERVFLFYGQMGAGKTTFINALCEELGVLDHTSSPTFSIVNEYDSLNGTIFHFDFYRLKNEYEALDMGYEEYFYSNNYCFVEWPEKINSLLPEEAVKIIIETTENQFRIIKVEKN